MVKISALPPMSSPDGADKAPIVDDSVSTTKFITLTQVKTWLQSLAAWITYGMIGTNTIRNTNIDWTAANGKIWWEELGRATAAGGESALTISSLPAKKYLMILQYAIPSSSGVTAIGIRLNNDSGSNYSYRVNDNGGSQLTGTSTSIPSDTGGLSTEIVQAVINITNVLAKKKIIQGLAFSDTPKRRDGFAFWNNTSAAITRADLIISGATFNAGSEIIVLGHD